MHQRKSIIVTGAAGFIGSSFIREAIKKNYRVLILDALTYAGRKENFYDLLLPGSCEFYKGDINDFELVDKIFSENNLSGLIHFAAESHVDNSIKGPKAFMESNVMGTFNLLEVTRKHYSKWADEKKNEFKFIHVSTDEVFGELGETGKFSEETKYAPNSPYSASKAASDMIVRAWHHTYKLPVIITNCSNNYGPRQFPEKLIPTIITNALNGKPLPVYGTGLNIRDWIHVDDHSRGVLLAFEKGKVGESYCFGGNSERTNISVVKNICQILDELSPKTDGTSYQIQISYVQDRAGHDFRYAIDDSKAIKELGFDRKYKSFEEGLRQTVKWYLDSSKK